MGKGAKASTTLNTGYSKLLGKSGASTKALGLTIAGGLIGQEIARRRYKNKKKNKK